LHPFPVAHEVEIDLGPTGVTVDAIQRLIPV